MLAYAYCKEEECEEVEEFVAVSIWVRNLDGRKTDVACEDDEGAEGGC